MYVALGGFQLEFVSISRVINITGTIVEFFLENVLQTNSKLQNIYDTISYLECTHTHFALWTLLQHLKCFWNKRHNLVLNLCFHDRSIALLCGLRTCTYFIGKKLCNLESFKLKSVLAMFQSTMPYFFYTIRISHWHRQATEGAEFWISCKRLKLLRKAGCLQLTQNSVPSVALCCQCDIQIIKYRGIYLTLL